MNAIIITVVHFLAFIGTGTCAALFITRKKLIPPQYLLILSIALGSFVGYGLFFAYAWEPGIGTILTGINYLVGFMCASTLLIQASRDTKIRKLLLGCWLPPLLIMFAATALYSSFSLPCQSKNAADTKHPNPYQACLLNASASDNILPLFFSDKLIENHDRDLASDWHLADRPPLQIGSVIGLVDVVTSDTTKFTAYQFFATFLQLSWVAALWALLKNFKLSAYSEVSIFILSVFSGFYFYNSVYVWPKLYAGSFILAALGLLFYEDTKASKNSKYTIIAFCFITLGLLAHGGVLFTLIPLVFMIAFLPKYRPPLRSLLFGLLAGSLLYAPWLTYKAHTTPSDRLVKWHFAGVINVDNQSTSHAIVNSYSNLTFDQWVHARTENFKLLFKTDTQDSDVHLVHNQASALGNFRETEFESTFPAFGLLNIGWLAIAIFYARRKVPSKLRMQQPLFILALASLVVWVLLMFLPGATLVYQGSYTTMILLFTVLISATTFLPRVLANIVFGLQILLFYLVWNFYTYHQNGRSIAFITTVFCFGLLVMSMTCLYAQKLHERYALN